MKTDLTICSVYHSKEAKQELEANFDFVKRLNPSVSFVWYVADNRPEGADFEIDRTKFSVCEGAGNEYWDHRPGWGSLRHTTALNKLFAHVATRFLLVLDPDFYIVRRDWIRDILAHMEGKRLVFFGSTWHPSYYTKYRYFPSIHCFFIDLEKVPATELNFLAGFGDPRARGRKTKKWFTSHRVLAALTFQNRTFVGDSRDSGWAMYEKFYGRSDVTYELLQAVYRPWQDRGPLANLLYWPNALLEKFLTDRFCFIPKRKGYYSTIGFREQGHPDIHGNGWQEFLWQGQPFAFHLMGSKLGYQKKNSEGFARDFPRVQKLLAHFSP